MKYSNSDMAQAASTEHVHQWEKTERLLISISFASEPRWQYYPLVSLVLLKDVSIVSWKTKNVNKIIIAFVKYLILKQLTAAV